MAIKRNKKITKADKLRNQIKKRKGQKESKDTSVWLPSGSVLFNLACSDHYQKAYKVGTMINIIGDSSSGKSFLALSGMAAMAADIKFEEYRLIYDDAEFADSFDHKKLFGTNFIERVEAPGKDENGEGVNSTTIEQFYDFIMDACEVGKPFIYVLDSFDAIDADAEIEKELKNREHRKAGNLSKIKGSFQATKQKKASQLFRHIINKLKKTKSVLIIISQTRDNLSALSFETKYRAGGRALKFYASIEVWLANKGAIKKAIKGVQHRIGVNTLGKITKNKFTGKYKEPEFPIYYDYGIDDISSCISFLVMNGWWKKKKMTIIAKELNFEATIPKLVDYIEEKRSRVKILLKTTQKCWDSIEEDLKLNRKRKF